jgi:DNA-binding response OmpR family regulator
MHKIMLVEDDPTMVMLLDTLLEIEGYHVVKPENFDNLLEEVRASAPDVVLLDVHLPGINGVELIAEFRQDGRIKDVRVIMSSGMDVRQQCMQNGADDFILKPYMPDELIKKIKNQINSEE